MFLYVIISFMDGVLIVMQAAACAAAVHPLLVHDLAQHTTLGVLPLLAPSGTKSVWGGTVSLSNAVAQHCEHWCTCRQCSRTQCHHTATQWHAHGCSWLLHHSCIHAFMHRLMLSTVSISSEAAADADVPWLAS